MMQITGSIEVDISSGEDNQKWVYKASSEGGVVLTNVGTTTTFNWTFDKKEKTLMNEEGHFAYSSKRNGLLWESSVRYLQDSPTTPWLRNQWEMKMVQHHILELIFE